MAKVTPISLSLVTSHRAYKSDKKPAKVTMSMCNYVKNNLNVSTLSEFADNVSDSTVDSNNYWKAVLDESVNLNKKTGKENMQIYRTIAYDIFPKLNKNSIKEAKAYIESNIEDSYTNKNKLLSLLEDYTVIDRIASNHRSLSKRFNIEKIAEEAVRKKDTTDSVYEICDLIDTYDIPIQAKFNIALENITYAMFLAGYKGSVIEEITDYYLSNNPIIPDYKFKTMQNLIKNSRVLSESDKESLRYFTEAKNDTYTDHIKILADNCSDKESKELILSALKINTEKQAAEYIKKAVSFSWSHENDQKYIIGSIFAIPLMGKVSKAFVSYQYKLVVKKAKKEKAIKDIDFQKKIEDILDDEDELMIEATLFDKEEEPIDESALNTIYMDTTVIEVDANPIIESYAELLESEDFADTEDIKTCINDFKAEQKKTVGRFRYYLGKIYRKSPENIIDETPHILSVIRYSFIIAPTVALPAIGPVISLVLLFIDKILSMKINDKQSEKLIRKLESELDKVDKDIEKKPEKKAELEKYKKCLEQCVKKVDAYREAHITDEELENRRGSSSDFDFGDDDFKFEDDDFKLEKALVTTSAINTILEAKQGNITEKLCDIITDESLIMDTETLYDLYEIASNCRSCIDIEQIAEAISSVKYKKYTLYEGTYIAGKITSFQLPDIPSTTNEIVMEAFCIDLLNEGIGIVDKAKEGIRKVGEKVPKIKPINLDKLKLAFHAARGKMKDMSTKEKALWKNVDIYASGFMRSVEKAMTNDRREGIIKGSLIPSFSKCIKTAAVLGGVTFINPVLGIIATMGLIGTSKALNHKERQLIYDEIDVELKVVDKELQLADNEGDMKKYRTLLQYQKRLEREKQRIKYGIKVHGRNIPEIKRKDDY